RMASTTFDLPQPLGPTMAVTRGGSSRTVRSLKDLNPVSSICLIRIPPSPQPPLARHPGVGRASLLLHELGVPVRRVDAAQERQPFLVATRAERLDHEGRPLWPERLPDQLHAGLQGRSSALHPVTAVARAHHVLPRRRPALRARDDMVEV